MLSRLRRSKPWPIIIAGQDAGDALCFDVRVRHAGGANRSDTRRPLLYLVFAQKWYTEDVHRRLLEDGGFAQPGARAAPLFPVRGEAAST